jgi:hypothetical protein
MSATNLAFLECLITSDNHPLASSVQSIDELITGIMRHNSLKTV